MGLHVEEHATIQDESTVCIVIVIATAIEMRERRSNIRSNSKHDEEAAHWRGNARGSFSSMSWIFSSKGMMIEASRALLEAAELKNQTVITSSLTSPDK
jgi:hypothetical protein